MMRSAWVLAVGALLTVWYVGKVYLFSLFATCEALCKSCDLALRRWSRSILYLAGVDVSMEGVEHLDVGQALIIIANHESWFDVWALAGCLPFDVHFVGKKELTSIPIFGRAWKVCGHVSVDRADRDSAIESMVRAGRQIKKKGLRMVFFAEGTRSSDGRMLPFKKGPFVLAIEGGIPVVPVSIVGSRPIMPKGSFRIRRGNIALNIGEPISVTDLAHSDRDRLRKTVRDAVVRLRGGEGPTSRLPGEPPLDNVFGSRRTVNSSG
ncbi:MAG: lysophospholipid acyltransferase family protein [Gemmatimonadota bacterium]|nr:lysophospholipid acyltransferase family protein [Gemmatimonadota bacterium]